MLKALLGDPNARKIKKFQPLVTEINLLEEDIKNLSDEELRSKTSEFKERLDKARWFTWFFVDATFNSKFCLAIRTVVVNTFATQAAAGTGTVKIPTENPGIRFGGRGRLGVE